MVKTSSVAQKAGEILAGAATSGRILDEGVWSRYAAYISAETGAQRGVALKVRWTDERLTLSETIVTTFSPRARTMTSSPDFELDTDRVLLNRWGLRREGELLALDDVFPYSLQKNSRIFTEFIEPTGLGNILSVTRRISRDRMLVMSLFFETKGQLEEQRPRSTQLIRELLTNVQLAVCHRTSLIELRDLCDALSGLRMGVILLDQDGRVTHLNRQAQHLLDRGMHLRLTDRRLCTVASADAIGIQRTVSSLIREGTVHRSHDLVFNGLSGAPLQLSLMLLSRSTGRGSCSPRACVGCFIGVDLRRRPSVERLQRIFRLYYGLSFSQAKVAAMIATGEIETAVAQRLELSKDTVRTHLARGSSIIRDTINSEEGRKALLVRLGERHDLDLVE